MSYFYSAPIEPTEDGEEVPPRPPSPMEAEEKGKEEEVKTPRMASLRLKMKDRLQKAKVVYNNHFRAKPVISIFFI